MSREIKFRAWDSETQKMWPWAGIKQSSFQVLVYSSNLTLMQFTGLYDQGGKPVFESDILTFSYGIPGRRVRAPVEFIDGAFYAITKGHNPERCLVSELPEHIGEFEIAGNVFEHPRLLEYSK